jgi:hypothetical protein
MNAPSGPAESAARRDAAAPPAAARGDPLRFEHDGGPIRYLISDLCAYLETYLPPEQISEVYRAYLFGAEAHAGQERQTGEPYIFHPIAVARILAEMRMDAKCLMAAILHDVIEDTPTAKEQLARIFGDEVAELVDGVSKLTQIDFKSRAEAQAANFQRLMLAMTRDIRVIMIKLADRLHNMRTLGVMAPKKRRRISRETLEIYAPIANRLGINSLRVELEDLGFRHHWPWRHSVLERAVRRAHQNQHEMVANVETAIRGRLQQQGIDGEVYGRTKHLYSIYRKMEAKAKSFRDLVDVYAFRVVVGDVDTCYRVLGQVHNLYKPMPGRFKDYIAIPKSNGYQALHTVLVGPQGVPLEIQVRTGDMDRIAEAGIAAHWLYKTGLEGGAQSLAQDWLQNLLEMQRDSGDSQEFLEHVKIDLFPHEVYVFTPKGSIMVLPQGCDGGGFRLCDPFRCGQHLCRGPHRSTPGAAAHAAEERSDGGDHHRPGGQAKCRLAQLCRHRQGAGDDSRLSEEPAAPRGRGAGPAHAECGAGGVRPRAGADRRGADRAVCRAERHWRCGAIVRRDRARKSLAGVDRAASGGSAGADRGA